MPHLQDLSVEWVSLVDRAAVRDPSNPTEPQRFLLWKAEGGSNQTDSPEGGSMTEAELTAALQKAEQERDEAVARAEKAEKKLAKKDKNEETKVDKAALPAEVRQALEKAEAERDALKKAADEAAELAKSERDLRVTREFVAKAEAEFPHVAQGADEFGPLLKSMSEKLSEEEFEAVTKRFRAANEQIRTSNLLKQYGQDGDPAPGSTGFDEAVRKAEELRKANPEMSAYDAGVASMTREQQAAYLASVR